MEACPHCHDWDNTICNVSDTSRPDNATKSVCRDLHLGNVFLPWQDRLVQVLYVHDYDEDDVFIYLE